MGRYVAGTKGRQILAEVSDPVGGPRGGSDGLGGHGQLGERLHSSMSPTC